VTERHDNITNTLIEAHFVTQSDRII